MTNPARQFIDSVLDKNYVQAEQLFKQQMAQLVNTNLNTQKQQVAKSFFESTDQKTTKNKKSNTPEIIVHGSEDEKKLAEEASATMPCCDPDSGVGQSTDAGGVAGATAKSLLNIGGKEWVHGGRVSVNPVTGERLYQYIERQASNGSTPNSMWADANGIPKGSETPEPASTAAKQSITANPVA